MKIVVDENIKKALIKHFWKEARKALVKSRQAVVDKSEHVDPDHLKNYVKELLNPAPVKQLVLDIWGRVGGKFANDTFKKINLKSDIPTIEYKDQQSDIWDERMRRYASERTLQKVEAIMNTQEELINNVIDRTIDQVNSEGLGIVQARKLMQENLSGEALTEIENYQAERIARTETGAASNAGSWEAAQEAGIEGLKKAWLHSGNTGKYRREEHVGFEGLGSVEMDYEFAPGLQYPCDENGAADQVINCGCTIIWDLGD